MKYVNISSNSWHYKLYCISHDPMAKFDGGEPKQRMPKSLCPYFWSCMAALIYVPFLYLGLFIMVGAIMIATAIWTGAQAIAVGFWEIAKESSKGFWSIMPKRPDKPVEQKKKFIKKEKEPSLVWQYMKARKKKVCPPLSVDGEIEVKVEDIYGTRKRRQKVHEAA